MYIHFIKVRQENDFKMVETKSTARCFGIHFFTQICDKIIGWKVSRRVCLESTTKSLSDLAYTVTFIKVHWLVFLA
jgi:hypothetical protein